MACDVIHNSFKKQNIFEIGGLYKLKFNDPNKFKIRYNICNLKTADNYLSDNRLKIKKNIKKIINEYNISYVLDYNDFNLYNSFLLFDFFTCIENNINILKTTGYGDADFAIFQQNPVFLFTKLQNNNLTTIIGSIACDTNRTQLFDLFGEKINKFLDSSNRISLEYFVEKIN